ncbi:hypothetical protein CEXT_493141 [Caerostris extrusa]|uniref:Secreted protein n=1 Tax=Caerostris extrusa TaxID=172846 RepID=A0AAV4S1A4_CAEEX|nr:hypothetical protein CEXT_493141 [Caerostris extrusa]
MKKVVVLLDAQVLLCFCYLSPLNGNASLRWKKGVCIKSRFYTNSLFVWVFLLLQGGMGFATPRDLQELEMTAPKEIEFECTGGRGITFFFFFLAALLRRKCKNKELCGSFSWGVLRVLFRALAVKRWS